MAESEQYHFIGIGGAGMSALARVLARKGVAVSGSESQDSPTRAALERELGIAIPVGQRAENLVDSSLVVISAAIKGTNPELAEARRRELPVLTRAEMLGQVMDLHPNRIAVSGTHGKTTTSAMIAVMLEHAGLDPTALIGGDIPQWGSNARVGASGVIVAEACEAYGSFLSLRPSVSVITNVEADHLDHYGSMDKIIEAFDQFLAQTSRLAVLWADDPYTPHLAAGAPCTVATFGLGPNADIRAVAAGGGIYDIRRGADSIGMLKLSIPGAHNVLNALAALTVGLDMGIAFEQIAAGLAAFAGTGRRFERLGDTADGITVVDDYAHHPTEIRATLSAAREAFPGRRIVAVFQPHLPSRTRDLMDDFAAAFADADLVVLTDIYLSREPANPNVTGAHLALNTIAHMGQERVVYVADKHALPEALREIIASGDVVLTMGAGDIRAAATPLLA